MYIDVHRCRVPSAQHSIMWQIQIKQVSAALPGFRIVTAVRQVWKVFDHIDRVRSMPQFGTWSVYCDRAETQVKNSADSLFGKSRKIAVGFRPTFRMLDHLVGKTIFFRILCDECLFVRHHCRPFVFFIRLRSLPSSECRASIYRIGSIRKALPQSSIFSLRSQRVYVTVPALLLLRLRHAGITYVASKNGSHRISRVYESEQGFRPRETATGRSTNDGRES